MKAKTWTWLKQNMPGIWSYAPPGGPFGRSGVPDRINVWRGIFFAIEAKADKNGYLSDLQRHELEKIKRAGGICAVLYGFEEQKLITIKNLIVNRTKEWIDGGSSAAKAEGTPQPGG